MEHRKFNRRVIAAAVIAVAAGGYIHFEKPEWGIAHAAMASQAVVPAQAAAVSAPGLATATDFSGIVAHYGPAVVNISVVGKAEKTPAMNDQPGIDPDDPFSQFFRRFGPQGPRVPHGGQMMRGQGSGFIVSPDGLILTNAHVVDGAQEVTVKLTDRREYRAKVLGADRQTDVAVIKIAAKDLPVVKIGDPAAAQVGEPVLAIGSPYGFENTATAGIISAKSRSLPEDTYVPFIQTDVAVNPGNSGGPLFNLKGEVIGINSQIYSQTGGYQGLSFAIPINVAARVQDQLVHHGKVTRGRIGVSIQDMTQSLADSFGLKKVQGALVASVEKGSPAEKAGLEPGDVIVRVDGRDINRSSDLPAMVAEMQPGTSAQFEVLRKGSPKTLRVTVAELKDKTVAQRGDAQSQQGRLGLAVRPLAGDERQQAGVSGGLLVEDVTGAAARSGIQPGDIVLSINGVPVSSVEQLRSLAGKAGRNVALLVQREEARIFVPIDLG
ncbi:MAG TPA: DegQ family serine endoprotease [Burkholderiaceae bacterium]|nr:DegQ family serine endoprotease [Burkholderiaceae bacterium]